MALKIGAPVDHQKLEIRNVVAHISAGTPSSPATGQFWVDSSDANKLKWYDGTTTQNAGGGTDATTGSKGIVQLAGDLAGTAASPQIATGAIVDADVNASAAIALTKLATDPLARANHTGSQLASTISNFDTQVRSSRLDQMTAPTASVAFGSQKITGLADPTAAQEAATKAYVDAVAQGLAPKDPVRVAATSNVTVASPGANVDGVAMSAGNRVLLTAQSTGAENGPWVWNGAATPMTRPTDFDTSAEAKPNSYFFVSEGTNADNGFTLTTDAPITLGTTSLTFVQFSGAGQITAGSGLAKTGNTLDVNVDASSIEINADILRVKALGIVNSMIAAGTLDLTTKVTGALPVANGGTGQIAAKAARETGLGAAGRYDNAVTHGAGTTITITAATHGLRATKALIVQTYDGTTGDRRIDDINVAANGDVVVTFATSQSANTVGVVIMG